MKRDTKYGGADDAEGVAESVVRDRASVDFFKALGGFDAPVTEYLIEKAYRRGAHQSVAMLYNWLEDHPSVDPMHALRVATEKLRALRSGAVEHDTKPPTWKYKGYIGHAMLEEVERRFLRPKKAE